MIYDILHTVKKLWTVFKIFLMNLQTCNGLNTESNFLCPASLLVDDELWTRNVMMHLEKKAFFWKKKESSIYLSVTKAGKPRYTSSYSACVAMRLERKSLASSLTWSNSLSSKFKWTFERKLAFFAKGFFPNNLIKTVGKIFVFFKKGINCNSTKA